MQGQGPRGVVVWLTGLSGAGKTTIAYEAEAQLRASGIRSEVIDGDAFRHTYCHDLGFSRADREENVRRIASAARDYADKGIVVLVAAIAPYRSMRHAVRKSIQNVLEVYVNASLETCEKRDVKGLYMQARQGKINCFTGISDPYEVPDTPDVECRTDHETVAESVEKVFLAIRRHLISRGML